MPADPAFWFELAVKMTMTAAIVVAASVVVERSGPFIGALIAALPTAAGAAYIILAIEHPPAFVAASAVGTMSANAAVSMFALTYAALAQRRGLVASLGGAFLVWFVAIAAMRPVDWTAPRALILNAAVFAVTVPASARFRTETTVKPEPRRFDLAWRVATVSICVAIVTAASHRIGSFASGMFAVFPVAMASFFIILHPRVGGPAAASVAAHVQAPLIGLIFGFITVHYLAEVVGVWLSLALGLMLCIAWNGLMWLARQRRKPS
jgi:hypothetical protein